MRHRNKTNALGRKAPHRKAMLANMATSLILHKRIKTTVAKAKVLRTYVEPVITKSKIDSTPNRRTAFRYLRNKYAVSELFKNVAPKVADRPGGYTRILKLGNRAGDNAEICIIELVDFNTTYNPNKAKATTKKRSRRGGKKKTTTAQTAINQEAKESNSKEQANEVAETDKEIKETVENNKEQAKEVAETDKEVKGTVEDKKEQAKDEASNKAENNNEQKEQTEQNSTEQGN